MRTIGRKVALWSALASTATLAILFLASYLLLKASLINGLDNLNKSEFEQISSRLGPNYSTLSAPFIEMRIRETTEYAATLFYIEIYDQSKDAIFISSNIKKQFLNQDTENTNYTIKDEILGEIRVGVFKMDPFTVIIGTPEAAVSGVMSNFRNISIALLVMMLILSGAIGYGLSKLALAPIKLIQDTASKISSDNLKDRIPLSNSSHEMAALVDLLNNMFDRIETSFNQVKQFTGEASHELKTPLSIIRLHSEKLLSTPNLADENKIIIQEQLVEIDRLTRIIEELLFISRAESGNITLDLKKIDPKLYLENFAQDAFILAENYSKRLRIEHAGQGEIAFEPKWMRQVLLNLLMNAINVSPPDGLISIQSELNDEMWKINVIDEGPGLTEDQIPRIFHRFVRFMDDKKSSGTGLGLAICQSLIHLHGGEITGKNVEINSGFNVEVKIFHRRDV